MRHATRFLLACALLIALPGAAGAQTPVPAPPGATTGAATTITRTTATLNGTVDPNALPTSYRFEYGTTTAYGLQTGAKSAGDGDAAVPADTPVEGLTPNTTYHFRIVATSSAGATNGEDKTFTTTADPTPPALTISSARQVGPQSALLRGSVDPNRAATSWRFEYGTTTAYGSRTASRSAGEGDRRVATSDTATGLKPYTRYHYRLVATNAAGTTRSRDRTFVTQRLPTSITLSLPQSSVVWGEGLELTGEVQGTGVGGVLVALERQDFPFAGPFSTEGTPSPVRADRSGRFRFFVPSLFSATRLHALTRSPIVVASPDVAPQVRVRVGAGTRRISKRRVRVRGSVRPAVPEGRAVLQRRTSGGGWTFVRGGSVRELGGNRSRYSFKVKRRKRARTYRIRVFPRDGGAHVTGTSREVRVRGRRARR